MEIRGHSKKLYLRRANTNIRKNFFTYRVISICNSLPEYVINARNVKIFESQLDKYWIYQDIIYDFKSNLTTEKELPNEELELSIVACGQRSEEDCNERIIFHCQSNMLIWELTLCMTCIVINRTPGGPRFMGNILEAIKVYK